MKWIVSELFYPDEVSTALIMTEIAEELAKSEKIGVICGPMGYESSYTYQEKELHSNIEIHRNNVLNLDKNKLLARIIRLVLLTFKMTFSVLFRVKKGDEVLMVTNPAFLLITVAFIKRVKNIKLDILVHDVFPENLVPADLIKKDSYKYKVLSRLFNWAYRQADCLVVLGEDMGELVYGKIGDRTTNIKVIPNWCDPDVYPIPDYSASDYFNLDLKGKITIGFAGNLGRVQGIPDFIDLFTAAANHNIVLILIGDGAMRAEIQKNILEMGIKNIFLVGSKPRSEQINFLNACDISLITLKGGMKGLGVPSKAYNVMGAGKPILYVGDKDSENDRYVKRFDHGWSFDWHERDKIVDFLKNISSDDMSDLKKKGMNSLNAVRLNFQKDDVLKHFNTI